MTDRLKASKEISAQEEGKKLSRTMSSLLQTVSCAFGVSGKV